MSQIHSGSIRRRGGDLDVFTGLLFVATVVLAVGVVILAMTNAEHSKDSSGAQGGVFHIIER